MKDVETKEDKRIRYERDIAKFWDKQVNDKKEKKTQKFNDELDFLNGTKYREQNDEDQFEQFTEKVISTQRSLGRDPYPIRNLANSLCLGKGPPLVASDNFDNKLFCVPKDIFYKPEDSRTRLSINWNPKIDPKWDPKSDAKI